MNRIKLLFMALALCLSVSSCGGSDESKATKAAETFLEALTTANTDLMSEIIEPTASKQEKDNLFSLMKSEVFQTNVQFFNGYKVLKVEIVDELAIASYEIHLKTDEVDKDKILLKKIDGSWYASLGNE